MPHPLAVVITTFNRCSALQQCLKHLENQARKDFEVVVVDDGSTDSTGVWLREYAKVTPLSFRHLRQDNTGQARARNVALGLVEAPVTVLIGDDIFASPQFTAVHTQLHEQRPGDSVVGLGLTVWAREGQNVTRFMEWLDRDGLQFNYGELLRGTPPDWKHFYTSNLSLKTSLLRQFPFDETFRRYGMEDIELACRIDAGHGLEMVFLPDAVAEHLHPMTFAGACKRMVVVGESSAYFDERWPGRLPRAEPSRIFRAGKAFARVPFALPLLQWLAGVSVRFVCPNKLMTFVLNYRFQQGYQKHLSTRS